VALAVTAGFPAFAEVRSEFDAGNQTWKLTNSQLEARFELNPAGLFRFAGLRNLRSGDEWLPAIAVSSSPIRLRVDTVQFGPQTAFQLVSQVWQTPSSDSGRLTIVLTDIYRTGEVILEFELYEDLPVLRYGVRFRNTRSHTVFVKEASPVAWEFSDAGEQYRALRIEQWLPVADPAAFKVIAGELPNDGSPITVDSGAHNRYCTWLALADRNARGLAFGWEFDGRAEISLTQQADAGRLTLSSQISDLFHPVPPGAEFQTPHAFVVSFHGDWDDAGYDTQRFVTRALAKPMPGRAEFPFVSWDSWAYGTEINEETLRRNADQAAKLGIELFVVDLGWARMLGDWREDPRKFPSGLRALSDYVHGLGMKFGLHFAFGEAMAEAPILQVRGHEDWPSSVNYSYYGAQSLCLAHEPVRKWIVEQAVRLIDEYDVDWILQDGENMVRECRKDTHTHHQNDSNYAGAVDGLGAILRGVQSLRPQVAWENCENGGNLMTFQMVQNYVTSIVNDASGALGARTSVYGATYPFPARYADRYMPEQTMDPYTTRSYLFGGPWIFMNRLPDLTAEEFTAAAREIERFKRVRPLVRDGKILHVSDVPRAGATDAIAAWDAAADSGVAVITRQNAPGESYRLRLPGAVDARTYRVSFASAPGTLSLTGSQLRTQGIDVPLPQEWFGEVVTVEPQ
jgi:alpha-galactosidase